MAPNTIVSRGNNGALQGWAIEADDAIEIAERIEV